MIPSVERRTLAAIVFTDVVGSTALKQKLGDKAGIRLIQRHHELLRQTLQQFAGAREIKTAGDSFFLSFPTPSAAVSFALLLQALHPAAMAGVAGHSGYRSDPWGRLQRTGEFIAMLSMKCR